MHRNCCYSRRNKWGFTFREPMVSLQQVLRDYLFNFYPFFSAPLSPYRDRKWFWQVIKWQEKAM